MNNLTTFQNKLITDLQNEFAKLNPPTTQDSGRFSIATLQKDVEEVDAFKKSIWDYNIKMSIMLKQSMLEQIKQFNKEFAPVNLCHDGLSMFSEYSDYYYAKNPYNAEVQLKFADGQYVGLYILYNTTRVTITTSCETISLSKIKGLMWSTRGWVCRNDSGAIHYATLDEFLQQHKEFQKRITNEYNRITKKNNG
jgi:hypothetical protein